MFNDVPDMGCYGYILRTAEDAVYFSGDAAQLPQEVLQLFLRLTPWKR